MPALAEDAGRDLVRILRSQQLVGRTRETTEEEGQRTPSLAEEGGSVVGSLDKTGTPARATPLVSALAAASDLSLPLRVTESCSNVRKTNREHDAVRLRGVEVAERRKTGRSRGRAIGTGGCRRCSEGGRSRRRADAGLQGRLRVEVAEGEGEEGGASSLSSEALAEEPSARVSETFCF